MSTATRRRTVAAVYPAPGSIYDRRALATLPIVSLAETPAEITAAGVAQFGFSISAVGAPTPPGVITGNGLALFGLTAGGVATALPPAGVTAVGTARIGLTVGAAGVPVPPAIFGNGVALFGLLVTVRGAVHPLNAQVYITSAICATRSRIRVVAFGPARPFYRDTP